MPQIEDRQWQRELEKIPEAVFRRGERRHSRLLKALDARLNQLEKLIMMTREEMRQKFQETLEATRQANGRVQSMETLLAAQTKQIKDMADQAEDLEEFRDGLDEMIKLSKSEGLATQASAAVDANPSAGDTSQNANPSNTSPSSTNAAQGVNPTDR